MTRRLVTAAVVLALITGACGLGDKQAQADRIIDAGKKLMAANALNLFFEATVKVLPVERQLVAQEPPRIAQGRLPSVFAFVEPKADAALVAPDDKNEAAIRFLGSTMYERIAPKTATSGSALLSVPSNFAAIIGVSTGEAVTPGAPVLPATTSTTTPRLLRRTVQIVREWAAFNFAEIPDRDRTKHGGSFAINPVALLRLTTGVLTGSVKRDGTILRANVSRDKAERDLSEDEREVLDKMFTANAITRRVFPARFHFDAKGLTGFELTLRQQLSSKDRADLKIKVTISREPLETFAIKKPSRRGIVNVSTLGQLVTTVSGL
jgi:hypothetical protein